jgi:heterodisulfide reductase subunit C
MASTTVWVCLSCETCTTYCPNEVQVAEVILHLRAMASRTAEAPREPVLAEFHQTFLRELQRFGRVNEFWLMAALNLQPTILQAKMASGDWKKEIGLGWMLLRKGRLRLLPHRCQAMRGIRRLYRRRRKEGL